MRLLVRIKRWACSALCAREIAAEAERMSFARELEVTRLKRQAVRGTCPNKIRDAVQTKLDELAGES